MPASPGTCPGCPAGGPVAAGPSAGTGGSWVGGGESDTAQGAVATGADTPSRAGAGVPSEGPVE